MCVILFHLFHVQTGWTALMEAAQRGYTEIVQYLVGETIAQVNATDIVRLLIDFCRCVCTCNCVLCVLLSKLTMDKLFCSTVPLTYKFTTMFTTMHCLYNIILYNSSTKV